MEKTAWCRRELEEPTYSVERKLVHGEWVDVKVYPPISRSEDKKRLVYLQEMFDKEEEELEEEDYA